MTPERRGNICGISWSSPEDSGDVPQQGYDYIFITSCYVSMIPTFNAVFSEALTVS
jgi:hypothetical protein